MTSPQNRAFDDEFEPHRLHNRPRPPGTPPLHRRGYIGHPRLGPCGGRRRFAHVCLGALEQKIGAGNQADDAVCHDIRAQAAVEFPVPKPTGCARPKSQGANQVMTSKKPTQRQDFKTGEFIVYPAHGVGQIVAIEEQEFA